MEPAEDGELRLLLKQILDAAIELQGADFGDVQIYDPDARTLRIVAHRGVGRDFLDHFACVSIEDGSACATALKLGARMVVEDVTTCSSDLQHREVAARTGYRAMNCTPLMESGSTTPLGMLTTLFREPCRPDEARLRLLDILAAHAAALVSSRRAQKRLRDSEEFVRLALESGGMGSWEWDSQTGLIKADAVHQAFFGLASQAQLVPAHIYWQATDRSADELTSCATNALARGKDIALELRLHLPAKSDRWIAIRGRPHHDGSSTLIGISYDITERKERENALRESSERLRAAVQLAGLGLYSVTVDAGGDLLTWDDRVRALWGLPPGSEVTYDVWLNAIHPDDRERVQMAVARAYEASGDGTYDAEYRVVGADGVERWVATRAQTRFDRGRAVSLLGVARDITGRKMIELGLELVVDVRTSELIDASATLEAERSARQRGAERLELLQGVLSRGLFAALESRNAGPGRPVEKRVREAAQKIAQLSRREREVLDGLVHGEPYKIIAHRLGISVRTVEIHRARMLHRLGSPRLADAIRIAVLAELSGE